MDEAFREKIRTAAIAAWWTVGIGVAVFTVQWVALWLVALVALWLTLWARQGRSRGEVHQGPGPRDFAGDE